MLKSDLVAKALDKISISGITAPSTEPDTNKALYLLEDMISEWEGRGITLGYYSEEKAKGTTESNLPSWANAPVYNNLAVRLCPSFKIQPSAELMLESGSGISLINNKTVCINPICYPRRMPRGSGNTIRRHFPSRFYIGDQ